MATFDPSKMKTRLTILMILAFLTGCSGPDQEPYSRQIAWEKASVLNLSSTNTYRRLEVGTGSNLVLEITDGYYRGKKTTAHSSHNSIYLILSGAPTLGEYMTFSFTNGTLDYDGFAGYDFNVIDTNMPAVAEISVYEVSADHILAEVQAALWQRNGFGDHGKGPSRLFVAKGMMRFERKEYSCRTSTCTLPSRSRAGK